MVGGRTVWDVDTDIESLNMYFGSEAQANRYARKVAHNLAEEHGTTFEEEMEFIKVTENERQLDWEDVHDYKFQQ